MKTVIFFCVVTLLCVSVSFGQARKTANQLAADKADPMPSVEEMIKTISSDKEGDASTADAIIDSVVDSMTERMQAKPITEETVKSAIEGTLIKEEVVPEVNRESVESIDTRTKRYAPRLKLDFNEFPLRHISGQFRPTLQEGDGVGELEQTNASLTDSIVRRVQARLKLETVRFEFKDRTAHLIGTVPDQRRRELIEVMLRMEPGIDTVKNELVVGP